MSLYTASLNSGSNGNCYYIANEREAVLIDAGLSCRETEKRMTRLGLSLKKVRAIFISHEHSDHISGVEVISRKFRIPVYINKLTLKAGRLKLEKDLTHHLPAYQSIEIGSLQIVAFPKFHDAADPHSFIVSGNNVCIGVFTDIGSACGNVVENFNKCHAAYLEANYDEEMLDKGPYPIYLKRRIKSDVGHLSNHQALELFLKHKSPNISHLWLGHLSKENNHPEVVQRIFSPHAANMHISVASRYEETRLFHVKAENFPVPEDRAAVFSNKSDQLSLFSD